MQEALRNQQLDFSEVLEIATELFNKINTEVQGAYGVSTQKLVVVTRYFIPQERKLAKAIIEAFPITEVKYVEFFQE
jgi:hypothetical protein